MAAAALTFSFVASFPTRMDSSLSIVKVLISLFIIAALQSLFSMLVHASLFVPLFRESPAPWPKASAFLCLRVNGGCKNVFSSQRTQFAPNRDPYCRLPALPYHSMNPGSCHPRSGFPKVLFCSSKPHANGYLIKHKNAFHLAGFSRAMLLRRNASRMLLGLPTCFASLFSCGSVYKKQRGACAPLHCPIHFNSESRLLLPLGTAWCKGRNSTHAD